MTDTELYTITPMLIIVLTILTLMMSISCKRNNLISVILTLVGLSLSLIFLLMKIPYDVFINNLIMRDDFSEFNSVLILISSLVISIFSYTWFKNIDLKSEEFYVLILIATLGSMLLTNANNLSTLFLGMELISLPLFGMLCYKFNEKLSFMCSIKYTLLSVITSSLLLFGMGLFYLMTGKLSFVGLNLSIDNDPLFLIGLGFILVSLSFKLSLIPFHLWTPDIYKTAPVPVLTFISTTSKIAIFSILLRFLYSTRLIYNIHVQILLTVISCCSIIGGNLMAINKCYKKNLNIKQILGYSSIINFGYLIISLISLSINHILAIETINIYIVNYVLTNLCIFSIIILLSKKTVGDSGLFTYHPILTGLLTLMIFSLSGVPLTLGFISKFYLLMLSINTKLWWFTGLIVIGGVMSIFYYLRLINNLYKNSSENYLYKKKNLGTINMIIVCMLTLLIIILGCYPQLIIDLTKKIHPVMTI